MSASLIEHLAERLSIHPENAQRALQDLLGRVHQQLQQTSQAPIAGLGLFWYQDGALHFQPEEGLARSINHRFEGLQPLTVNVAGLASRGQSAQPPFATPPPVMPGTPSQQAMPPVPPAAGPPTPPAPMPAPPTAPAQPPPAPAQPPTQPPPAPAQPPPAQPPPAPAQPPASAPPPSWQASPPPETDHPLGPLPETPYEEADFAVMNDGDPPAAMTPPPPPPSGMAPDVPASTDDLGTTIFGAPPAFNAPEPHPSNAPAAFDPNAFGGDPNRQVQSAPESDFGMPPPPEQPYVPPDPSTIIYGTPPDLSPGNRDSEMGMPPPDPSGMAFPAQPMQPERDSGMVAPPPPQEPTAPRPTRRPQPAPEPERNRMALVLLGIAALVIFGGGLFYYFTQEEGTPEAPPVVENPTTPDTLTAAAPLDTTAAVPAPEPVPVVPSVIDRSAGGFSLVTASETDEASAEQAALDLRTRLGDAGVTDHPVDVLRGVSGGTTRYRIAIGQFNSEQAAVQAKNGALRNHIPTDAWVIRIRQNM